MAQSAVKTNNTTNAGLNRQSGLSRAAFAAVISAGLISSPALGHQFNLTDQEICDAAASVKTLNVSGTEGMGFQDRTAYAFKPLSISQPHRLGEKPKKIFTYAEMLGFARQEVCTKLDRAIYVSSSGNEDPESNNKNEPWYWNISFNRWNIEYHYPELRV